MKDKICLTCKYRHNELYVFICTCYWSDKINTYVGAYDSCDKYEERE